MGALMGTSIAIKKRKDFDRRLEEKKKARMRSRGPYRKSKVEMDKLRMRGIRGVKGKGLRGR